GEVAGHRVDVVGQLFPDPRSAVDYGLPAQHTFCTDVTRHARHLVGEGAQRVDHRVDGVLQGEDLTLDLYRDFAGEVAIGNRSGHVGDVTHLIGQVAAHQVHVLGELTPNAGNVAHLGLHAERSLGTHQPGHTRDFGRKAAELVAGRVDGVLQGQDFTPRVYRDLAAKVAFGDRGHHLRDIAHLIGQVVGHEVHVLGELRPDARRSLDLRLTTQDAVRTHLARNSSDFVGERAELVDHCVDGVF